MATAWIGYQKFWQAHSYTWSMLWHCADCGISLKWWAWWRDDWSLLTCGHYECRWIEGRGWVLSSAAELFTEQWVRNRFIAAALYRRRVVLFLTFSSRLALPRRTAVDSDWLLSGWLSIVETVGRTLRLIGAFGMSEVFRLSMCGRHSQCKQEFRVFK